MRSDRFGASALAATACVLMAAGVALGAFGAHALRARLTPDLLAVYETGVRYHLVHGVAACIAALWAGAAATHASATGAGRGTLAAGWLFVAGTLVFSGSLYVLALSGARWLGAITPFGGAAWIAGWLILAWSAWRQRGRA